MAFSETPIFPGKVQNSVVTLPNTANTVTPLFVADGTHGGGIKVISVFNTGGSSATITLRHKIGTSTARLNTITIAGSERVNILQPGYIPGVDANDPVYYLGPSESIEAVNPSSGAIQLEICSRGFSYQYPN
jgi:hypothetical protein